MREIDYDKEIPIPAGAYLDRSGQKAFYRIVDQRSGQSRKETIGKIIDGKDNMMNPCYSFEIKNPDYLSQFYPEYISPINEYHYGLYALSLGVVQKTGLYQVLEEVYNITAANAILDYCMFLVQQKNRKAQSFESEMKTQALFSNERRNDKWYSEFFQEALGEDLNHEFKIRWISQLKDNGLRSVWLGIAGLNNDSEGEKTEYGQSGSNSKETAGYIFALDAETGRPVTYFPYEGRTLDENAFIQMKAFLHDFDVDIEGIVLDSDFESDPIVSLARSYEWKYVIMLPLDAEGYIQMVAEHGSKIRLRSEYRIPGTELFGCSDVKQLFSNHSTISAISLFYSDIKHSQISVSLLNDVDQEIDRLNDDIAKGRKPEVNESYEKYLRIEETDNGYEVIENNENLDNDMEAAGFFSMATSDEMTPQIANRIYELQNAFRMEYGALQSQGSSYSTKAHAAEIQMKFAVAFISSIIRREIELACAATGVDADSAIQEMNQIAMIRAGYDDYIDTKDVGDTQRKLLSCFGISLESLTNISREINERLKHGEWDQRRTIPTAAAQIIMNRGQRGRRKKAVEEAPSAEPKEVNKGGRPKGSRDTKPRKPRSDKGKPRKKRKVSN